MLYFVVIGIPYCIHFTIQVQCYLYKKIMFFNFVFNVNFDVDFLDLLS